MIINRVGSMIRKAICSPSLAPKVLIKSPVVSVEAAMIARLVPISAVEINHSGCSFNLTACRAADDPLLA
ncbi:MAG: hypothetical protein BWX45_00703 [Deltaproteobacteria bacterium ADurb.Bin002]|nr:MAG: hypothetical protein BWX45_00703 [Deltaproteobacteria bacterium ADurb.Bin002]